VKKAAKTHEILRKQFLRKQIRRIFKWKPSVITYPGEERDILVHSFSIFFQLTAHTKQGAKIVKAHHQFLRRFYH
jgi:hypothetical protein